MRVEHQPVDDLFTVLRQERHPGKRLDLFVRLRGAAGSSGASRTRPRSSRGSARQLSQSLKTGELTTLMAMMGADVPADVRQALIREAQFRSGRAAAPARPHKQARFDTPPRSPSHDASGAGKLFVTEYPSLSNLPVGSDALSVPSDDGASTRSDRSESEPLCRGEAPAGPGAALDPSETGGDLGAGGTAAPSLGAASAEERELGAGQGPGQRGRICSVEAGVRSVDKWLLGYMKKPYPIDVAALAGYEGRFMFENGGDKRAVVRPSPRRNPAAVYDAINPPRDGDSESDVADEPLFDESSDDDDGEMTLLPSPAAGDDKAGSGAVSAAPSSEAVDTESAAVLNSFGYIDGSAWHNAMLLRSINDQRLPELGAETLQQNKGTLSDSTQVSLRGEPEMAV